MVLGWEQLGLELISTWHHPALRKAAEEVAVGAPKQVRALRNISHSLKGAGDCRDARGSAGSRSLPRVSQRLTRTRTSPVLPRSMIQLDGRQNQLGPKAKPEAEREPEGRHRSEREERPRKKRKKRSDRDRDHAWS